MGIGVCGGKGGGAGERRGERVVLLTMRKNGSAKWARGNRRVEMGSVGSLGL